MTKTQSETTKIALLERDQVTMASNIKELKDDVKQIKDFLMGENPRVVTKTEFEATVLRLESAIRRASRAKWIYALAASLIASFFALMIAHILQDAVR